ncbi:NAD(P)H-dependent oxidoreductase [Streptomyces sp. NPDC091377]|uniref:NAD(P)H-dependent oxidoreductase n=1 Tax=Streptomyces sp. NPDC091377 TaxID=3365995 RepID=UPI003803AC8E
MCRRRHLRHLWRLRLPRRRRYGPTPAKWSAGYAARREGLDVDLSGLAADHDCSAVLGGNDTEARPPAPVRAVGERVAAAEALVVVTPGGREVGRPRPGDSDPAA